MKEIIFVTSNKNKLQEAREILGLKITSKSYGLDEIQDLKLANIVKHKAYQAFSICKKPVIVEDVSLEIKNLGGLPGPFIKYFEKLLVDGRGRLNSGAKNRTAVYRVGYGYYDKKSLHYFEGSIKGAISKKPLGKYGFGFDVIFIPEGQTKTYAQLGASFKNKNSARYLALVKLSRFLNKHKV